MTDNEKMRDFVDEVKQLCKDFSDLRDRPYMGDVVAALDSLYKQWQAAQSVPVVGEPVAYACPFHAGEAVVNGTPCMLVGERNVNDYAKERGFPLIVKPTTSITDAELERLRKDAERYRWMRDDAFNHSDDCFFEAGRLFAGHQGDSFDVAVDAAMLAAAPKKEGE